LNPVFSKHALEQLALRQIQLNVVWQIIHNPQQVIEDANLAILQSIVEEDGQRYLLRIFVNLRKQPPLVVTVYKTSKIEKYWQ
jgi:hypothetical protein